MFFFSFIFKENKLTFHVNYLHSLIFVLFALSFMLFALINMLFALVFQEQNGYYIYGWKCQESYLH